ncbi:MAG: DNA photolyase family protein [Rickettsiales bacterium]|nr:DNA photolyase family protein [Rickettsiales bacterium]
MPINKLLNIVWMRRDLRLHDHAALHHALKLDGEIQPVFVFDAEILQRFSNPQDRRLTFIAQTLLDMDATLRQRGGAMLVLHGHATKVMPKLAAVLEASTIVAAADIEADTRKRDADVLAALGASTQFSLVKDCWLQHGGKVLKKDGTPYHVFTPYAKAWHAALKPEDLAERVVEDHGRYASADNLSQHAMAAGLKVLDLGRGLDGLLEQIGYRRADMSLWPTNDGHERLSRFIRSPLEYYSSQRNMVAQDGTSALSPYLRFGLVSIRECARAAWNKPRANSWINELVWRDFYAMILFHYPETVQLEFMAKYRGTLAWKNDPVQFKAWQSGQTGYPLVDAAMRQLWHTGWMHNRARMVVASFLTKHLQIDWRLGEEHFAQYLMDYDLASNVGGWQWAASTGTDAQPYFRIFNPITQSINFDPDGEYIRRYVPELKALAGKKIFKPWENLSENIYPNPIVNHSDARIAALEMFKIVA